MSKLAIFCDVEYPWSMKKIQIKNVSYCALLVAAISLLNLGCQSVKSIDTPAADANPTIQRTVKAADSEVSVMTYNVENLFDALHDADREDFTFLPLAQKSQSEVVAFCETVKSHHRRKECQELDWNDEVVQTKLKNIGAVIRSVDNGHGPDNLLLAEVENESILKRLVNEQLNNLGYQTVVLIEGPDLRGIDPAFISKFPLKGKPELHIIPYQEANPKLLKWAKRSRGILEVTVVLPNQNDLTFLVGHFPSQSNPTQWRSQAVQYAKNLMQNLMKQGRSVILGGDLNIIAEEEAAYGYFKNELSQVGSVSHLVGCSHCSGTHNYRGHWAFLDVLIFSSNLKAAGLEMVPESIEVIKTSENMTKKGLPMSFSAHKNSRGASDHFPLFARLKLLK